MAGIGGGLKFVHRQDYNQCIQLMKLLMTPFVCFWAFGFPDGMGIVELISGFVVPTFFVLSGYCVLEPEREVRLEKLKRALVRSAIFFAQIFVVYIGLNVAYFIFTQSFDPVVLRAKRFWFEFLVLNVWPLPVGNSIWFIQALLYAYIFLFIADKLKLLRFYKLFLFVLLVFMVLVGELAGVISFNILGYGFIPGGAITRALPYLLLGMFLRRAKEKLENVPFWVWLIMLVLGGGAVYGEAYLLAYMGKMVSLGHFLGYGLMAVAICGLCIALEGMPMTPFSYYGGEIAKVVYVMHNPFYYALLVIAALRAPQNFGFAVQFGGIIVFVLSLVLGVLVSFCKSVFKMLFVPEIEDDDEVENE